ncbi:cyclic peptide export ABC transporter [Ekhidna sp.]|uniref:cyclic peptide export ABC transporter n=2 Tax=Ekhidna sp. TaxID=2608089 RepID=UPI003299205F
MGILKLLLSSSKRLFFFATLTSILTGVFSTFVIKVIHEAIQDNGYDANNFITNFFLFLILYGVFSLVSSYSITFLTQKIIQELRIKLSTSILKAKFESIEHHQQKLLPILTEDVKTIANSIDRLPSVTTGLAKVIGILIYMIWYSPTLTIATLIILIFVIILSKFALPYVRKYADQSRNYLNSLYEQFHGLVFGIKELALNKSSKKKYLNEFIVPTSDRQNKAYLKENIVNSTISRSTDLITFLAIGCLIIIVFKYKFVSLDVFGEYLTLVLFTLAPIATITGFFGNFKRIEVAIDQVNAIGLELSNNKLEEDGLDTLTKAENKSIIKINHLEHSYYHSDKDQHFAMGPIDLSVKEGETLFLVGGNGSGKTTLAKLILGLYKPLAGHVEYYGQKITAKNIFSYRSHFAAVFTDSYLFQKFLDVEEAYVEEHGNRLLKIFQLEKKVKIVDHGFSTKRLSEGQKKRLSLINAILENKDIYLFDEWAANQDPVFKEIFYQEIIPYLKVLGKTQIVISHDDQYFHLADRVVKLRDGKVTEMKS